MKKTGLWASALTVLVAAAVVGSAAPAFAATTAGPAIETSGYYNFVGVSPDGSIVASVAEYDELTIHNVSTGETNSYDVGYSDAAYPVISPDNAWVYIASYDPEEVIVVNASTGEVDRTISLPFAAWTIALTPDGDTLLVSEYAGHKVVKVDLTTDTVSSPLNLSSAAGYAWNICLTSDGSTLYVPGDYANKIYAVDVETLAVTNSFHDSDRPQMCALDASDTVYVADYETMAIRKFAADGSFIITEPGVVTDLYGFGVTCDSVIVGDDDNQTVAVLDASTLEVVENIATDAYTYSAVTSLATNTVWFGGYYGSEGLQSVTGSTCTAPVTPALASTGVSTFELTAAGGLAFAAVFAGAIVFVARRRKA